MSLLGREFTPYNPFGPYIVKSSISDETFDILLDTANKIRKNKFLKNKNDYRKSLAGNLSEEYSYANAFTKKQEKIIEEELCWLASVYTKTAKKIIFKDLSLEPKDIVLQKPIWVNFMKSGEWNPLHSHTADISCVIYLQVPDEISEENLKNESSSNSNTPSAGKIDFQYGDDITYSSTGFMVQPKEKDIFLFPARLRHMVYPFKSNVERISVSCNFANKIKALKDLNSSGER